MRLASLLAVAVGCTIAMTASGAAAWEIPLTVESPARSGIAAHISCGVPLLPGQAKDVKDLRLLAKDAAGKTTPVPAQFRELARWWRADNSVRWVLVDLLTTLEPGQAGTFVLTDAKVDSPAPPARLDVAQDADTITVTTGPARVAVSRKKFNLLDKAIVDVNGDGKLTDDENLLAADGDRGTIMEDTFGQKYFGSERTAAVEVIEQGRLRVCVRARGRQLARDGKGYSAGMYGYDVFLNFYAGSCDVSADVIVTNNFATSFGTPAVKDASLVVKLAGGIAGGRVWGDKPVDIPALAAGESVCLYQDSNGADTWKTCPGFGEMTTPGWRPLKDTFTTFRGYRVTKRAGDKQEEIAAGNHARGLIHAWNGRGDVVIHTRDFWQQFPKAAEVAADGTIRIGLLPREFKFPHCIPDSSAKGHEIVLSFHGAKAAGERWAIDAAGRLKAEDIADRWNSRLLLRPAVEHMAACGALSDCGPYTVPTKGMTKKPGSGAEANGKRMLEDDELYGNAYGWRVYGERWRSNGGDGSHGARQPIDQDNYLYLGYVTGLPDWQAAGDNRSRHFRDVRCYRIDDQDAMSMKTWLELRDHYTMEKRERPIVETEEMKKYQAGLPDYGSAWEFPNPEHCVLDLLYDRYLLFGDQRSLEGMRIAAAIGGLFARDHAPPADADMDKIGARIGRDNGWSWRTLERYWDLTGDKKAEELLKETIKAYDPLVGKSGLWFGNDRKASMWFTHIFSRAIAMTALHTGDAKALEICKAFAVGKERDAQTFATLFAVLYHLTGDEKYKEPLAEAIKGDSLLSVGGYYPASDHYLLTHPPKKP